VLFKDFSSDPYLNTAMEMYNRGNKIYIALNIVNKHRDRYMTIFGNIVYNYNNRTWSLEDN